MNIPKTLPARGNKLADSQKHSVTYYRKRLTAQKREEIAQFEHYLNSQRYSKSTKSCYLGFICSFLGYFVQKDSINITLKDIHKYNSQIIIKSGYSVSYQRQFIGALKLFYGHVIHCAFDTDDWKNR